MGVSSDSIRILHVDDDPDLLDLVSTVLEGEDDRFAVETVTCVSSAEQYVEERTVHCVVSDYELPQRTGLDFLQTVRKRHPDLPFILFTGKGSEEVASDAVSAGVTDYMQKSMGTDQYTVLANRIANAVRANRATRTATRRQHRLDQILKTVPACVVQIDYDGRFVYANRRAEAVLGLERDEVRDRTYDDPDWKITDLDGDPIPPEDLPFRQVRDTGEPITGFLHAISWPDGTRKILRVNGAPIFDDDGGVESTVFALSDVTEDVDHSSSGLR